MHTVALSPYKMQHSTTKLHNVWLKKKFPNGCFSLSYAGVGTVLLALLVAALSGGFEVCISQCLSLQSTEVGILANFLHAS